MLNAEHLDVRNVRSFSRLKTHEVITAHYTQLRVTDYLRNLLSIFEEVSLNILECIAQRKPFKRKEWSAYLEGSELANRHFTFKEVIATDWEIKKCSHVPSEQDFKIAYVGLGMAEAFSICVYCSSKMVANVTISSWREAAPALPEVPRGM